MDMQIERAIEASAILIKAAEKWSPIYKKDRDSLKKIIKVEARLERMLRKHFVNLANNTDLFVNWYQYRLAVAKLQMADNFNVDVIVDEIPDELDANPLMQVLFSPISVMIETGLSSGETIYKIPIGVAETNQLIERAAKEKVAQLVGKKVTRDGIIVDNPNKKVAITETTRRAIRESIATSLSMRLDQTAATENLMSVIKNRKRAEMIAQTETVNSFATGIYLFGQNSGAIGKEWENVGATDVCALYSRKGIVKLNYDYNGNGLLIPAAHPRCRCGIRLVYPEELEQTGFVITE